MVFGYALRLWLTSTGPKCIGATSSPGKPGANADLTSAT